MLRHVHLVASLAVACLAGTAAAGPVAAEFAIRWDPSAGGPDRLDDVTTALGMRDAKAKAFEVRYFRLVSVPALPAGFTAIGRERSSSGRTEATYKLRGPQAPAGWRCPLTVPSESKQEVDVTLIGPVDVKRTVSVSCTADDTALAAALPRGMSATPLGCRSTMMRRKKDEITVERWQLPGGRIVFEVSMKGADRDADLAAFRTRVAEPLARRRIVPLTESKTELGSAC